MSVNRSACFLVVTLCLAEGIGQAAACTVTASTLAFGAINPLAGNVTYSTANIDVTCPTTTSYTIAINGGGGTVDNRRMISGVHTLAYQLYTDASSSVVWGDGTLGTSTVSGSAGPAGTTHIAYGHVPWQQFAYPGSYSDALTVTVTF